jgi:methyl coenzyme M reductase subunit C
MEKQIMELLTRKLEELKLTFTDPLTRGAAKDFGEYQNLSGVIRGLTLAQREIDDLVRRLKEAEDE